MAKTSAFASQVNWLFLSEEDIRKARQIIAAAGPESTVDVLGLGIPLEKISDLFFPGTSTLHTELRYVIFVPAILYAMLENGGVPDPFGLLKRKEAELIGSLQKGGLKEGVIGRTRGEALKYWPSMTYWTAVNTFRTLGPETYERTLVLERLASGELTAIISDDGDSTDEREQAFNGNPRFRGIALSVFSDVKKIRWPEKVDFDLTKVEATYLRDQILQLYPNSLYVELLRYSPTRLKNIQSIFAIKARRKELTELIRHSMLYSSFAMGATLAYRWALCDHFAKTRRDPGLKDEWAAFRDKNKELFLEWTKEGKELRDWRVGQLEVAIREAFPEIKPDGEKFDSRFITFCNSVSVTLKERGSNERKLQRLGQLAKDREENLKKNHSRFRDETIAIPENVRPKPDATPEQHLFTYRWEWGKGNAISMIEGLARR